jgi:NADPH-dependent curcumin reductase
MRMSERTNAQVWLKSRPNGIPQRSDFGIRMAAVPQLAEGQLLIRNEFLSVDPAMRGWICDAGGYSVQIGLGETIRAFAVGEVIESNNARYPAGTRVMGLFGWQEYAVMSDNQVLLTVGRRCLFRQHLGADQRRGAAPPEHRCPDRGLWNRCLPKLDSVEQRSSARTSSSGQAGPDAGFSGHRLRTPISGGPARSIEVGRRGGYSLS